jgi:D-alanyl-D-alanine carboxypeptidase
MTLPAPQVEGVPSAAVTPWHGRRPSGAVLPLLLLAGSMSLLVSCVSITDLSGEASVASARAVAATVTAAPVTAAPVTAGPATLPASSPALAQPTPAASVAAPSMSPTVQPSETTLTLTPPPPTVRPSAGVSLDASTQRKLAAILERTTGKDRVAGLQAAVRLADGQTWLGSAGSAQLEPQRPVTDDTVFSIASITKTFIAALILELAQEGKLELDVPFGRYWADAPRKDTVTIRQLLSHTSGIYNYFEHPRYAQISRAWLRPVSAPGLASREHAWTYDEIMDLVKTGYCRAGECYHYSNTNYVILGRIAEAVGGAPLNEQLRRRFFKPLGLADTVYQPAELPPPDAAHGYWDYGTGYSDHTRDSRLRPFEAALTVADAAGAIASTARDLSTWASKLYGGSVLASESLAQMTTMLEPGLYGLGADVAVFAGHRAYGHRGGLRGFESSMWYFPDKGVSIVLLSNQGNWLTDEPMEKLAAAVLGRAD